MTWAYSSGALKKKVNEAKCINIKKGKHKMTDYQELTMYEKLTLAERKRTNALLEDIVTILFDTNNLYRRVKNSSGGYEKLAHERSKDLFDNLNIYDDEMNAPDKDGVSVTIGSLND